MNPILLEASSRSRLATLLRNFVRNEPEHTSSKIFAEFCIQVLEAHLVYRVQLYSALYETCSNFLLQTVEVDETELTE